MKLHYRNYFLIIIVAVCFVFLPQASAQYVQQGSKLVGTGAVGNANQGYSVSLSGDGNTAIVGGISDNNSLGAAWVFIRSDSAWSQQGAKLFGTGAVGDAAQGGSVGLSSDGNTAIVGGLYDNSSLGAAWVFVRSNGVWSQQGTKLVGSGAVGTSYQGRSVALSADGNTAIVGGNNDNSGEGAAWVWTRSGGVWSQQGTKLVGSGAVGDADQGYCVALSADGNTAIIGGYNDNSDAGAAWVFVRSNGVWSQQYKLVGTSAVGNASQGYSVALSANGNTAIVGGLYDNSSLGAAWVFVRSDSVWSQQGAKLVGAGAVGDADQGRSVALSADGDTAIVGGPDDNNVGAAWVFVRSDSVWSQEGSKLASTGAVGNAYQGSTVALSANGNIVIVGGSADNNSAGAAWVWAIERPTIVSIKDIPEDQGGKVRVTWNRVLGDTVHGTDGITSYSLWRRIPSGMPLSNTVGMKNTSGTMNNTLSIMKPLKVMNDTLGVLYDFITSVPDVYSPSYNVVAQTLSDSTSAGNYMETFLVTAQTSDPNVLFMSLPDSGYSVDNLAPGSPGGAKIMALSGGAVQLSWNKDMTDPDVGGYVIYRSESSGFPLTAQNKLAFTVDTIYVDDSTSNGHKYYYCITTEDIHGNQSTPTPELSETVTGVVVTTMVPKTIGLSQNYPNPFNPTTVISYQLPVNSLVTLKVYDILGREVSTLVNTKQNAGYYSATFNGANLPSGVYFYRLQAGTYISTKKLLLLK